MEVNYEYFTKNVTQLAVIPCGEGICISISKNHHKALLLSTTEKTFSDPIEYELSTSNRNLVDYASLSMSSQKDIPKFIDIINKLRNVRPDINITTDLIIGFPYETNELFEETIETIKKINFTKIHVFPYSKRSNTEAANMPYQVDEKIKKERVNKILELSASLERQYYEKFIDNEVEVLIEDGNVGLTDNYIKVKLDKNYNNGEILNVKVTKVDNNSVYGEEKIAQN